MVLSLFLLLGIFLLILIPYKLELDYQRGNQDDLLKMILWVWRFPFSINVSYIQRFGNKLIALSDIGSEYGDIDLRMETSFLELIHFLRGPIPSYLRRVFKRISFLFKEIEQLQLFFTYSTGEAAITGVATGVVWALISPLYNWVKHTCRILNKPIINIEPSFGAVGFELHLNCIFSIRLGHIIFREFKQHWHNLVSGIGKRRVQG